MLTADEPIETLVQTYASRSCLACGYDLQGLGEEPRCPECGLLNVPQGYREEVWGLVDSGKWFFSGFFGPFKKRPGGWWWSLDRARDVGKSWRTVLRNFAVSAAVLCAACLAVDLFKVSRVMEQSLYDPNSTERKSLNLGSFESREGATGYSKELNPRSEQEGRDLAEIFRTHQGWRFNFSETRRIVIHPRADVLTHFIPPMLLIIVLVWAYPAMVGIFTQIRKSLPPFANARRTIVSAANLESHQMVYNAMLAGVLIVVFGGMWLGGAFEGARWNLDFEVRIVMYVCLGLFGMARWVGPVRSDYTKQLIQSRFHAGRIVVLYAAILPWATALAVVLVHYAIVNRAF